MKIELYCSRPNSRNASYDNEHGDEFVCSAFILDHVTKLAGKKDITLNITAEKPDCSCFEMRLGVASYDYVRVYSETVSYFHKPKLLDAHQSLYFALFFQISKSKTDVVYVWFEETQTKKQ